MANDPIHQFHIEKIVELTAPGGMDISLTNSGLYMLVAAGALSGFLVLSMRQRKLVPGRWQSAAETLYEFVADMVRQTMGQEGQTLLPAGLHLLLVSSCSRT